MVYIVYRMEYAIRVDAVDFIYGDWLSSQGSWWAVKELEDNNPHFHIYLRSDKKISAIRADFKRKFPDLKGNGKYSITVCRDPESYAKYMAKGGSVEQEPEVVGRYGLEYSDEWISDQHEAYWERNRQLTVARRKVNICDAIVAICKEENVKWDDRKLICEKYIRECGARNRAFSLYSVRSVVNLVSLKLCPNDEALEALALACVALQ